MQKTGEQIREERKRIKAEYKVLYDETLALLFRHDPIGINFEDNSDEYAPEVGTILPRLKNCSSAKDVQTVVFEEFQRWFGDTAGHFEAYDAVAIDLWERWCSHVSGLDCR